jgi:hypothetical protein
MYSHPVGVGKDPVIYGIFKLLPEGVKPNNAEYRSVRKQNSRYYTPMSLGLRKATA